MGKGIALITGASAGIGHAIAEKFAEAGYDLILAARRIDRLNELKESLGIAFGIEIYPFQLDVRDYDSVRDFASELKKSGLTPELLINNAGLASGLDDIDEGSIEDWDKMMDTNVKGLLYVSREIIPLMVKNGKGHVINIGSLAGREVYPKGAVYTASKHAVKAINDGMRMDLLDKNIKVSSVNPGLVETEFSLVRFHGDQAKADSVYKGMKPLKAEDVADTVLYVASAPDHVNIADVLLLPADQAASKQVRRNEN